MTRCAAELFAKPITFRFNGIRRELLNRTAMGFA